MSLTVLINKLMIHMYSMSLPNTRIQTSFFLHQKNPEFIVFNFTLAIFRAISLSELLFLYCFQLRPFDHFIWFYSLQLCPFNRFQRKQTMVYPYATTRNIVHLNSSYIKFDSKHYFFYLYNKYYN
jgi:hypothetical protein